VLGCWVTKSVPLIFWIRGLQGGGLGMLVVDWLAYMEGMPRASLTPRLLRWCEFSLDAGIDIRGDCFDLMLVHGL